MNATVHQNGYPFLVAEDHITHVVVILVRMVEHVKLMELITFVIVFHVSFEHTVSLNDLHSNWCSFNFPYTELVRL